MSKQPRHLKRAETTRINRTRAAVIAASTVGATALIATTAFLMAPADDDPPAREPAAAGDPVTAAPPAAGDSDPPPGAEPAQEPEAEFDYGSCPPAATACVDLAGERTWLQGDGEVYYGAVPMSSGEAVPAKATPPGTYHVQRKVKDEISYEIANTPMPYSVYFTNTGIAFHEGDVNEDSHGCIHLNHEAAVTYFSELQVGDMVYVY